MEQIQQTTVGITSSTLQHLVNMIVTNYQSAAGKNNTQLLNEVKLELPFGASMQQAAAVMNELLATVVFNSQNGDIHITAEKFRDVVIIEIQERNNNNGYALSSRICSLAPEAEALGGHISIKGPQQKVTTISFSFPDKAA